MKKPMAIFLIVACSVICAGLGVAGGADYVLHGMDKINQAAFDQRSAQDARDNVAHLSIVADLSAHLRSCESQFRDSTLIYESAPQVNLAVTGLRGLPIIPVGVQGNSVARWAIRGRVTPQAYGDPRGAVYYFAERDPHYTDGRLRTEGPFVPEQVPTH